MKGDSLKYRIYHLTVLCHNRKFIDDQVHELQQISSVNIVSWNLVEFIESNLLFRLRSDINNELR